MHSCATSPPGPRVEHRVVRREPPRDVVGGEDRAFGRGAQALAAHHRRCTSTRSAGSTRCRTARPRPGRSASGARSSVGRIAVARQERREMRLHRDRTDAGAAAAVRNAERLVQVEVRHVGAELAGRREPDQRVEVRAVDVHLAAVRVHDLADAADAGLEHAVRRRVGDHDRGELARVLRRPCASRSARSTLPSSSQATTTTCMPAICADAGLVPCADAGNEADVAMRLAAARVVRADHQQAGVLALRAGVGLQRHRVVAGRRAQHPLEVAIISR